jgi:NhaP-type Na+/H+ or K+/H+ antiporter
MARIETTRVVRFTLYTLLVYVVVMLLLILVRFLRIFPLTQHPAKKAAAVSVWTPEESHNAGPFAPSGLDV